MPRPTNWHNTNPIIGFPDAKFRMLVASAYITNRRWRCTASNAAFSLLGYYNPTIYVRKSDERSHVARTCSNHRIVIYESNNWFYDAKLPSILVTNAYVITFNDNALVWTVFLLLLALFPSFFFLFYDFTILWYRDLRKEKKNNNDNNSQCKCFKKGKITKNCWEYHLTFSTIKK